MRTIYCFLFLYCCSLTAQVPEVEWVTTFHGVQRDKIMDVNIDAANNKLVIGYSNGASYTFAGVEQSTGADYFLAKLDSAGNSVWHHQFPQVALMSVRSDADGNIYLAGALHGPATFGTTTINVMSGSDNFIAKYTPDMEFLWVKRIASPETTTINDIAIRDNTLLVTGTIAGGNIVVGTTEYPNPGNAIGTVASLDLDGNVNWLNYVNAKFSDYNVKGSLGIDSAGNCFVAGRFAGTLTVEGNALTAAGATDGILLKYAPDGALSWAKKFGGPGLEFQTKLAVDGDGNCILAGQLIGSLTIGSTTVNGGSDSNYIAKVGPGGNVVFAKRLSESNGCIVESVMADAAGKLFVAATLVNSQNFITFSHPVPTYMIQALIVCNSMGVAKMVKSVAMTNHAPSGQAQISAAGDVYFYGFYGLEGTSVGPFMLTNQSSVSSGAYDFDSYLAKLNANTLGVTDFTPAVTTVWPNPATDYITITSLGHGEPFRIYALSGKLLQQGTAADREISVTHLAPGFYLLEAGNGVHKFIKK